MTNRSKARGTSWESAIVRFLSGWWPHVERRTLNGAQDKGDIAGIPSVIIEAKNCKEFRLAEWVTEAEKERVNAKALVGVVWAKRRGKASAGDGYVIMTGGQFAYLLKEAGF